MSDRKCILKLTNCLYCDKLTSYYQLSKGYPCYNKPIRKYCCKECSFKDKVRLKNQTKSCLKCGINFTKNNYLNSKYCSRECAGVASKNKPKKEIKKCTDCNSIIVLGKRCKICSSKNRKIMNNNLYNIYKNKAYLLQRILIHMAGGCCIKCGYNKSSLVFHHKDPLKKLFVLGLSGLNRNIFSILEEFEKCELLCHNCHIDIHNNELKEKCKKSYEKSKIKYTKRKLEYIIKCGGKCLKCNKIFDENNFYTASFHHKFNKVFELNAIAFITRSDKDIENEGNKCDLLCMNCHMEIHNP